MRGTSRPIRVAVLALGQISGDTAGRTYLSEILGPLGDEPGIDVDVHVADRDFRIPSSCRVVRHRVPNALRAPGRLVAEARVARMLSRGRCDVLLAPLNFLPATWRGPAVAAQHNVLSFGHDVARTSDVGALRGWYRPRALALTLRRATEIIAISHYLRQLILDRYPALDPARVRVVPYAAPARWATLAAQARPAARSPRVLVVSALWKYKRVDQAIEAFAEATRDMPEAVLEIAGPGAPSDRAALEALAARVGARGRVAFLGNVDHDELARRYADASALLYLSDIESFGLPVLEAMTIGLPVVAKRIGGVAEVGGDAPFWVEGGSTPAAAAAALRSALVDAEARRAHVARGSRHAAKFSWERSARLTADALRSAWESWPRTAMRAASRPTVDETPGAETERRRAWGAPRRAASEISERR